MSKIDSFIYKTTLNDYLELYNSLPKIDKLNPKSNLLINNKDYYQLQLKNGNKPALCIVPKYLEHIPLNKKYYSYVNTNPIFWMIPVDTISNKICGFLLKGFKLKNYSWIHYAEISLLFGFEDFKDYQKGTPIIICEGWRDCLYIKQFYKYSLAINTASLNNGTVELLSHLTNKILLILDNDETGRIMTKENTKKLNSKYVVVESVQPKLKDLGEYFTAPLDLQNKLLDQIESKLEILNYY